MCLVSDRLLCDFRTESEFHISQRFLLHYSSVGLTASCFGLGATLSNLLGQIVVEKFGHMESLMGSFVLSIIPIVLFGLSMPETLGLRQKVITKELSISGDETITIELM